MIPKTANTIRTIENIFLVFKAHPNYFSGTTQVKPTRVFFRNFNLKVKPAFSIPFWLLMFSTLQKISNPFLPKELPRINLSMVGYILFPLNSFFVTQGPIALEDLIKIGYSLYDEVFAIDLAPVLWTRLKGELFEIDRAVVAQRRV
jgi:hypothetical protein